MLADSEPQEYMTTHQTRSWLARPNKKGGVKLVSTLHVRRNDDMSVCLPDAEYSHPPEEGPSLPIEGWLHTLHPKEEKPKLAKKPESTAGAQGHAPQMKKGGQLDNPQGDTQFTGLNRP